MNTFYCMGLGYYKYILSVYWTYCHKVIIHSTKIAFLYSKHVNEMVGKFHVFRRHYALPRHCVTNKLHRHLLRFYVLCACSPVKQLHSTFALSLPLV